MKGRHGNWYAAEFRPRTDPLRNLAEGLADLVARKFGGQPADLKLDAVGEPTDTEWKKSDLRSQVRDRLVNSFKEPGEDSHANQNANDRRGGRAWTLLKVLRDFAAEVDVRDKLATDGLRAGPANLLLLVDQFEEVFRPEALARGAELLDLLIAAHAFLTQTEEGQACGLYIVVTMRTEELHRVGEYPALTLPRELTLNARRSLTLADVVTSSFYLIQVMDPDQDRTDLRDAIVQPAREVLDDYGLLPSDLVDAPFDDGVVDWLLDGARSWRDAAGQGHKADQLPLLQHALRAMWRRALDRWNSILQDGSMPAMRITKADLPQPERADSGGHLGQGADLAYCLDHQANRALYEAAKEFNKAFESNEPGAHSAAAGDAALRAAIRALARRDDRGNWARRFATIKATSFTSPAEPTPAAMDDFLAIDPATSSLPVHDRRCALSRALQVLKAAGYLSEGVSGEYDISHEALIRNWGHAQTWLREPSDTAQAIERVLKEVDPSFIGHPDKAAALEELMPRQLVERLAPIEDPQSPFAPPKSVVCLPTQWSKEQIRLVVGVNDERSGWGSEDVAFEKLRKARRQVIEERSRMANREDSRRRRRRMFQIGLPALGIAIAAFITLALSRYQEAKEIAAGGWALGEMGHVTSLRSLNDSNSLRAKGIADAQEYLARRRSQPPPDRDELLKFANSGIDFAARYVIGATLTPMKEPTKIPPNLGGVICWSGESSPDKPGNISIGATGTHAQLKIENGKAELFVADGELKGRKIEPDLSQQLDSSLDATKLPPNGRVCMTTSGSTLIVATPWSLSVLSLLWKASNDKIVLRGWPVTLVSGSAPEAGLPCIHGVHESPRGDAVFTQVFYKLLKVNEDSNKECNKATSESKAMAFVRGLFTPVALPSVRSSGLGNTDMKCRLEAPLNKASNEPTRVWSCGEKASGRLIYVNVTEWPTSASEEGKGAVLSLTHTREDEIFPGPFVIDVAAISRDTEPNDLDIAIACRGDSISLLISNKSTTQAMASRDLRPGTHSQTWTYLIGARAIGGLLREMSSAGKVDKEELKPGNPISLLKVHANLPMSDQIVEASAETVGAIQRGIAQFFNPPPPPLCSPPSTGSVARAD
jgi:hypothetical protein